MEQANRTALVTGATGFVGRRLCQHLQRQGWRVIALAREAVEALPCDQFIALDLQQDFDLREVLQTVDEVFYVSGLAHADAGAEQWPAYRRIHVEAAEQMAQQSCASRVGGFHYVSSIKAVTYDTVNIAIDTLEQYPPEDVYGVSKWLGEQRLWAYARQVPMRITLLRPSLVYGAGVRANLATLLRLAQAPLPLPLAEAGRRSMIDVDDLAEVMRRCAERELGFGGCCYEVSDGQAYSARRLYQALRRAVASKQGAQAVAVDGGGAQMPLWCWRLLASVGDILEKLSHKPMPWSSQRFDKVFGDSFYYSPALYLHLNWHPRHRFDDDVEAILAGETR